MTFNTAVSCRRSRPRRGAALMIVLVVIAVATVLGFAMVSASSLQAQTAGNLKYVATAEYLADSGAQLAMYYLQNPTASPVARPSGYYPGQTGITFGSTVTGTADVTVTYDATSKLYTVKSIGKASTNNAEVTINKTVTATVAPVTKYTQSTAVTVANNLRLYGPKTIVNGNIDTNGTMYIPSTGEVYGNVRYRTSFTKALGGVFSGVKTALGASDTVLVPSLSTIRDYTGKYTYQGRTYTAQKLTSSTLSSVTMPSAGDAVNNPAGVYWTDQNLTVDGGVTFNGTIVVTSGYLRISGLLPSTFTPKPGFPAVVVQSDIDVYGASSNATFNGLVWTGGILKTGATGSVVTINGAYLSAGSTPIDPNYLGKITITYAAANVAVPDFSTTNAATVGVRVASWTVN